VSDFHYKHARFGEMVRRLGDDRSHQIEAVAPAGKREHRLFPILRR
jgi:hypothetical protein